ncbi:MAG: ATP-binding protein, partial [Burkholderiales bacterium]|nr:ATP-binding protein [Burkholderiales bacterium]
KAVLESLREPLESGKITISRAAQQVDFPARFELIAAMNPCPCGYLGHPSGRCHCTSDQVARYRAKISGPFLDRIDIRVEMPPVRYDELSMPPIGETSERIRSRVEIARKLQMERQGKPNAELEVKETMRFCRPDSSGEKLIRQATDSLHLSGRAYHKVLRIARSMADLEGSFGISKENVAEAIQYRRFDA